MKTRQQQHNHQQAYFDSQYAGYQDYSLENWRVSYIQRIFGSVGLNEKPQGFKYLDVGVGGSGYTVIEAARAGAIASGTDLSEQGIASAARLAGQTLSAAQKKRVTFKQSEAEKLPFKDKSFDGVSSIAVLEHVVDHQKAMAELVRVTKDKGKIFIAVPNLLRRTPLPAVIPTLINDRQVGHLRHYSEETLRAWMEPLGTRAVGLIYTGHYAKLFQMGLSLLFPSMKQRDSRWWWRLEHADLRAGSKRRAAMMSMVFQKYKTGS